MNLRSWRTSLALYMVMRDLGAAGMMMIGVRLGRFPPPPEPPPGAPGEAPDLALAPPEPGAPGAPPPPPGAPGRALGPPGPGDI